MKKLLLTLSLLLCAGYVAAQTNPNKPTETNPPRDAQGRVDSSSKFEAADTNHDGSLSQSEFDGAQLRNVRLAQVDKDSDGRISRDEWNNFQSEQQDNPTDRR